MRIRAPMKERGCDAYFTPPAATEKLLSVEHFESLVWEPCCGDCTGVVRPLRAAGHEVLATDLVNYGVADQQAHGWDFLMESKLPFGCRSIVSNPPYSAAAAFVRHAIELGPAKVAMLLRLSFLEGAGRADLHERLSRVWVFRSRLPMMHRAGWNGAKASNPTAYCWCVWDPGHRGPHQVDWL